MNRLTHLVALLVSLVLPLSFVSGEDAPATIKVQVKLVEVYATVFDHSGRYVDGLARENFEVLEDGKPQSIRNFEANHNKIACAILLDTTGSMNDVLPRVKNSVVALIDALGPADSVAIFTFDTRLQIRQAFTTDKEAAKVAILRSRAGGRTALFDAIAQSTREVAKAPGKKALVVFTDGADNASVLNAKAAVLTARKVGVPVYTIAEGEAARSLELKKILAELSHETGASSHQAPKAKDVDEVFQKIVADLQHLYMLSYKPEVRDAETKWRSIGVTIRGRTDLRVRSKEGYYPD